MVMTYRDTKGSPLTSAEVDTNFRDLVARDTAVENKADFAQQTANQAVAAASTADGKAVAAQQAAATADGKAVSAQTRADDAYANANGRQPANAKLSAIAESVWVANRLLITTGANTIGDLPSGETGRALIATNTPAEGRSALALGTAATATITTSTSDTTTGRVLRVGDHGIGGYAIPVTGANVDTAATTGFYFVTSAGPSLPIQALGYLLVHSQGATYCTQVFCTENGAQSWQRSKVNNVWGTWSKQLRVGDFGVGGYGTLVTSDTINTLVASGFYYCNSVSGVNLPVSVNGFLLVHAQGALYCKQIFSHVTDGRTWERYLVNGVWGNWDQVLKASQLVSSNGDTATGKVLTVGYMGIGSRAAFPASSANTALFNGFYQGAGASSTDYPSVNTGYGNLLVMSGASNYLTQISTFAAGTGIALSEMHFRGSNNNGATWAPWAKVFHSGNAVGTVSQASGLPTGAIIERISNGNGQATKYADGTLVCWGAVTTASIPVNTAAQTLITFPSAFSTAPVVSASVEPVSNWDHYGYTGSSGLSGASGNFFVRNGAATAQQFVIRFFTIGRWF